MLKGERLGTVCYIGRLDFDSVDHIYIGIHLDQPGNFVHTIVLEQNFTVNFQLAT